MALQSSGQISLSDIANEQEIALSNVSLRSMSSTAGFTTPDSVSEFYGYAYKYYWDLSNDIKWDTAIDKPLQSTTESFSASLWIRPQWAATDLNLIIFDLTPSGTTSTANRFFLQYDYGLNAFVARYRSSSTNFTRSWALHSNNDATGTGASSTDYWTSSNRGDTNSDGFIHLFLVYDASQSSPTDAFKLYWNATELRTTLSSDSGTRSNMTLDELTFCGNDHNTSGSRIADYMFMHMWDDTTAIGEISTMYNSGSPISAADAGYNTNLIFGDRSESVPSVNDSDDSGNYQFAAANGQSVVAL